MVIYLMPIRFESHDVGCEVPSLLSVVACPTHPWPEVPTRDHDSMWFDKVAKSSTLTDARESVGKIRRTRRC